jgi:alpha-mannosidase
VTGTVTGTNPSYDENEYSFLTISDPDILLWALKPAEDGIDQGVITRVWNHAARNYTLSLAPGILSGKKITHIETGIADAAIVSKKLSPIKYRHTACNSADCAYCNKSCQRSFRQTQYNAG